LLFIFVYRLTVNKDVCDCSYNVFTRSSKQRAASSRSSMLIKKADGL